ncbi:TolC family protein [Geobacter pelophilus]|uniref:TolC family protein n=1 Tax=Geoanaerobacter pelophilus TaxID=60036 RepID=A0AAW4L045_9BACT|nr:TolC family protein [Geoanaerobacter pelophilus]MBT0663542.1 TolC family protein [Geoanaerobacter pelophilus]
MKRFVFVLLSLLISTQPLYAATDLTLDEALGTALKNHPQVIEAKENLNGAEAKTGQALANYYPQINLTADWIRGQTYFPAQETIKISETNTASLYLKQTIYDFGRTAGVVEAARGNREAADNTLAVTRQDLTLRVRVAFYLVLALEKQVQAVRENVKAREEVFRQAQEFFTQGIRARVDVARSEANFFAAKTNLIRAESNREIARVELANAMGIASLGEHTPVATSSVLLSLPERNSLQQDALRNRAELQQFAAMKSAASGNLTSAKSSYLPILSGVANIGYADRDFPPTGNVWGVGLNLTVPLFSGFSSVEQVREATAAMNSIEARQNNLKLQIIKEVESAWFGGNDAAGRIVSTQKEVDAANESKSLAEGRYQEGIGSIIEVTDAQSQTLDAQTANIQAKFDYYTALARLDRAVGKQ